MGNYLSGHRESVTDATPGVSTGTAAASALTDAPYKVFISHAGQDKATIAIPLRKKLAAHNISAFVDEEDMQPGTDAVKVMTAAMETAKVAVVVLSPEFIARKWPMRELMCFLRRYEDEAADEKDRPVIIPVFYRLTVDDLYNEPNFDRRDENGKSLYDMSRFFERMSTGEPEADISKVKGALRKLHKIMGIRNDDGATNESTAVMWRRRDSLLETVCNKVVEVIPRENNQAETMSMVHETDPDSIVVDHFCASFPLPSFIEPAVLHFDGVDENDNAIRAEGWAKCHLLDEKSESPRVVAIHGMGGVGKSTILQGLAADDDVRRQFRDGVYVMRLGADATKGKLLREICAVLRASGAGKTERHVIALNDIDKALDELERWFIGRRCVFLIDDVWGHAIEERLLQRICKIGGARSSNSVLVTTRENRVASLAPSDRIIHMKPLEVGGRESREILFFHAEHRGSGVMSDASEDAINKILEMCGGLAVGLSIAGKNVKRMKIDMENEEDVWKLYVDQLGACASTLWREDLGSYEKLFTTFETSLAFLDEKSQEDKLGFKTKLTFREMHWRFCVLPKQDIVPGTMLSSIWETPSVAEAEKIASVFAEMGLANRAAISIGKEKCLGLRLHDSLHDFAIWEASRQDKTVETHEKLLAGYSSCDEKVSCEVNGTRKWWSDGLLDDGYIHRNLCRHLQGAGLERELVSLLMTPGWAARQLNMNGILALEDDFLFGLKSIQATRNDENAIKRSESGKILQAIWETFNMSWAFVVARNRRELWFQVYGRLVGLATELRGIRLYLNRIKQEAKRPWLQIDNCVLSEPFGVNTKTVNVGVAVSCMVEMGDWERFACGCDDGSIALVNIRRGEVEFCWKAHDGQVRALAIARNGSRLVSTSKDKSAKVWDLDSRNCVATFAGHSGWVFCAAVMGDGKRVVTGSTDGTALVWDMDTGRLVSEPFTDHNADVMCVTVLGDGNHVITGGFDRKLRLWNTKSGTQVGDPFVGHTNVVRCVCVTPDGKRIVSGSWDCTIRIWNIEHRRQLGEPLRGHTSFVRCVSVSRDGGRFVSGSTDQTILVWDLDTHKEVCPPLGCHKPQVTGISFLMDRYSIVSCSREGIIRVWNVQQANSQRDKEKHDEDVTSVAFTPNGRRVVSGSYDRTVRIWDPKTGRQVVDPLLGHSDAVTGVALMPDGRRVVSVSHDRTLRVWHMQSGEILRTITGHTGWIQCVAVTANGDYAATGSDDKTIRVWNLVETDCNPTILQGHSHWVKSVFFSDDGKRVISVYMGDTILVWELDTQQLIKKASEDSASDMSRKQVLEVVGEVTVNDDAGLSIQKWQRKIRYGDGEPREVLGTLEANVTSWALSSDKRLICVGLRDGRVGFMHLEK